MFLDCAIDGGKSSSKTKAESFYEMKNLQQQKKTYTQVLIDQLL